MMRSYSTATDGYGILGIIKIPSGNFHIWSIRQSIPPYNHVYFPIYSVFVTLLSYSFSGVYLMVITECRLAAKILGSEVYCIVDATFLPFANMDMVDIETKQNLEKSTLDFRKWIGSNTFYFSYSYDITTHAQRTPDYQQKDAPLWTRVDLRFFWNRRIHEKYKMNVEVVFV